MKLAGSFAFVLSVLIWTALPESAAVWNVGSSAQLFIDQRFIASAENVRLEMTRPGHHSEPVLRADQPWENHVGAWASIIEEGGLYRLWYDVGGDDRGSTGSRFQCYAESSDGINWTKPRLGVIEFKGSKDNNIVMVGTTGSVFLDPNAGPEARFKYIGWMREVPSWPGSKGVDGSVYLSYSADGVHWKRYPEPALPFMCDTQNQAFWDPRIQSYVAYLRSWQPGKTAEDEKRTISRIEIKNLTPPWSFEKLDKPFYRWKENNPPALSRELPVVFGPDFRDPSNFDHYNLGVTPYPFADDVYFGFSSAYQRFEGELAGLAAGTNDGLLAIQLAVSRDGVQWNRPERRPFIDITPVGQGASASIYMTPAIIRREDELWLYYAAGDVTHGGKDLRQPEAPAILGRTDKTLRRVRVDLHRFMAASLSWEGGEFTTPPVTFRGNTLELNIDTSALGSARVELLSEYGLPIPGYTAAECNPIAGNHLHKTISWGGKTDLGHLSGTPIRLRVVGRGARIYAFQFQGG